MGLDITLWETKLLPFSEEQKDFFKLDGECGIYVKFEVFHQYVTHNLTRMADLVNLYDPLWNPEELNLKYAKDIKNILYEGLSRLKDNKERCEVLNPANGFGSYEALVEAIEKYKDACEKYPEAEIRISK
jgi:hypothetical protein